MTYAKNSVQYPSNHFSKKGKSKSKNGKAKHIRVAELFAGVGGFRLGLEKASSKYKIVWSNQWEPTTKKQHASEVYTARFGNANHSNEDIAKVDATSIPCFDMLVAGFPCQDYSIANRTGSEGITGKKGVLWWEIHRIAKHHMPALMLLENVDRLLVSPSKQKGRDFAIMLASLSDLGYAVEWRVINAADYGMPQRRKRVFILAVRKETGIFNSMQGNDLKKWLVKKGVFASSFPVVDKVPSNVGSFELNGSLACISNDFSGKFFNSGIMTDRRVYTLQTSPLYSGPRSTLSDVLQPFEEVSVEFHIPPDKLPRWHHYKGAKKAERIHPKTGGTYIYKEGPMPFPDALDKPSRTMITSEGESSASRLTHVVMQEGVYRRLTPIELERLNMFPDNHTFLEGITNPRRGFFMGNALVVGVIEKVAKEIIKRIGL